MKPLKPIILILLVFSNFWVFGQNNNAFFTIVNDTSALEIIDDMPSFPDGEYARILFMGNHIKYPELAKETLVQGTVIVSLIVETDGSISNIKVVKGIGGGCDEEAVRVIKLFPKWKPAKQNGKAIRVMINLPVIFRLR